MSAMLEDLEAQVHDMDMAIDHFIKILELDNKILRYVGLFDELDGIKADEQVPYIQHHLALMDKRERKYQDELRQLAFKVEGFYPKELNNDNEIISAIVLYMTKKFSYDEKIKDMLSAIEDRSGRCFHLSQIFKDLCLRFGIEAYIVKGYAKCDLKNLHCWNKVVLERGPVYFDLTFAINDPDNDDRWFWRTEENFLDTHIKLYEL